MTNPPPYDSAPTLNATQATDSSTPPLTAPQHRGHRDAGQFPVAAVPGRQLRGQLDQATAEQHQDQPDTDGCRGGGPGQQIYHPAGGIPAALPAGTGQARTRVDGDRRDRGACACACAQDPQRRGRAEEQGGQGQDGDQAGDDERGTADQRAQAAAQPPRAEDRQLGGGRAGQQVTDRDGILELLRVQPFALLDAQIAEHPDVSWRPAEPDAADPAPLAHDGGQGLTRRFRPGRLHGPARGRDGAGVSSWPLTAGPGWAAHRCPRAGT